MPATLLDMPMVGPYTVIEDPDNPSTPTNPTPNDLLADGSESTWVDVSTYIGLAGVFLNQVYAVLVPPSGSSLIDPGPRVQVFARFRGSPVAGVRLVTPGSGSASALDPDADPIESALGTLYRMDSNGLGQVNNAIAGYSVEMQVYVPAQRDDPAAIARIYEAGIVVRLRPTVAPSCRKFPRSDGLGVGGPRIYPPPVSQQRSGRRFGYY